MSSSRIHRLLSDISNISYFIYWQGNYKIADIQKQVETWTFNSKLKCRHLVTKLKHRHSVNKLKHGHSAAGWSVDIQQQVEMLASSNKFQPFKLLTLKVETGPYGMTPRSLWAVGFQLLLEAEDNTRMYWERATWDFNQYQSGPDCQSRLVGRLHPFRASVLSIGIISF